MMSCGTVGTGCFHIKYFKKTYPKCSLQTEAPDSSEVLIPIYLAARHHRSNSKSRPSDPPAIRSWKPCMRLITGHSGNNNTTSYFSRH